LNSSADPCEPNEERNEKDLGTEGGKEATRNHQTEQTLETAFL